MPDDEIVVAIPEDGHIPEPGEEEIQRAANLDRDVLRIGTDAPERAPPARQQQDEGAEELRRQLASMQGRVGNLTRQVSERDQQLAHERARAASSEEATITSELSAAEADIAAGKRELTAAFNAGDADKVADAQEKIADASARKVQFQGAKASYERGRPVGTASPREAGSPRREQVVSPVSADEKTEQYLSSRTPQTREWLNRNRAYANPDSREHQAAIAADTLAVDVNHIVRDTPEYFQFIEKTLGIGGSQASGGNMKPPQQVTPRPLSASVAPVAASSGGVSSGGVVEVRLTKGEADSATDGTLTWNYDDPSGKKRWKKGDPIGVREMARRKSIMKSEGRYDRVYVDG
jgi:hypothetical protein